MPLRGHRNSIAPQLIRSSCGGSGPGAGLSHLDGVECKHTALALAFGIPDSDTQGGASMATRLLGIGNLSTAL